MLGAESGHMMLADELNQEIWSHHQSHFSDYGWICGVHMGSCVGMPYDVQLLHGVPA